MSLFLLFKVAGCSSKSSLIWKIWYNKQNCVYGIKIESVIEKVCQGLSHVQNLHDSAYHAYHQDEQGSTAYITRYDNTADNCYQYDALAKSLLKSIEVGLISGEENTGSGEVII